MSIFLLLGSAVFGVLNGSKVKTLRADMAAVTSQRDTAERQRAVVEKAMKAQERAKPPAEEAKPSETHIASAEAELVKIQTEKSDLQAKLQANEAQIAELQQHVNELAKTPPNPNPGAPSLAELQAQLDDARQQLASAEQEKALVTGKNRAPRENIRASEGPVKRREQPVFRGSIRGTVLAVNNAYNFVVLNLGNRQGVEANAEMLVLRGGSTIGKIRVSSVEPSTAIADIQGNSVARGVQVQPGDIVIYAGSNP